MLERAPGVPLHGLDDGEIERALQGLGLHLRPEDVRRLVRKLERRPTAAELALLDSMWSEHCSYKSTRTLLRRLPTRSPNVVLGPGADAGVVRLPRVGPDGRARLADAGTGGDGRARCIAIAHESHNHPSQLLPYEGAATGVGGIVRDVYCMGAEVVGVLDALRFGDPDGPQGENVRQIVRAVVSGIAAYGNALGVPNLGGEVDFEAGFDDNCLVNVVALGILDEDELIPSRAPQVAGREGYVLLLVGKPTDDSGVGGASFASVVLDTDEETQERGAVQLPDPFFKRVLTEANKAAIACLRRHGAPFAMKDLGAAGLGGASSEMAAELGLALNLDAVHADQGDRTAAVLLVAETQERYVLAVPEPLAGELRGIYERDFELGAMVRGAGARVVGRFDPGARYRACRDGRLHVDLPTEWITRQLDVEWPRAVRVQPKRDARAARQALAKRDLEQDLHAVLASAGGSSRYGIFAHYDCDVQGRTSLRPGDADAGVLVLRREEPLGIAIAVAGPARLGKRDAWRGAAAAVCEAARNVVAVGATPWALTDCLNSGSPETPHGMQDLDDSVRGLGDAARALGLRGHPGAALAFVSGNVSLYNESRAGRAIPPTPIVACLGVLCDYATARGLVLKQADDLLFHVGTPCGALGGSLYAQATRQLDLLEQDDLPALDVDAERDRMLAVLDAFDSGLVQACHDLSDGGLLLALVEMAFGRSGRPRLGVRCMLPESNRSALAAMFSESPGFICEVQAEHAAQFESMCATHRVEVRRLGVVLSRPQLQIDAADGSWTLALEPLARAWRHGLDAVLREEVPA
ncbi:MAG: phosphoribosylformylglycinamidine synthase subunit PurL [Candidatus Krumholzibacteriia bacterium]